MKIIKLFNTKILYVNPFFIHKFDFIDGIDNLDYYRNNNENVVIHNKDNNKFIKLNLDPTMYYLKLWKIPTETLIFSSYNTKKKVTFQWHSLKTGKLINKIQFTNNCKICLIDYKNMILLKSNNEGTGNFETISLMNYHVTDEIKKSTINKWIDVKENKKGIIFIN